MNPFTCGIQNAKWWTAAALLAFSILTETFAVNADTYIALDLSVTQTNYRSAAATWSARCVFGEKKWLIESRFSRNAAEYFYCDGTNVYRTVEISHVAPNLSETLESFKSPNLIGQTNLAKADDPIILRITPGTHPLSDTGANLPWLAYCSGGYIRSTNQPIPLIVAIVPHNPWSFAFEHEVEAFQDDLGLPKKLTLLCSEKRRKESPFDMRVLRTDDQVRLARTGTDAGLPMIDGMVAARYTVLSATNIAGRNIPTVFRYEQFQLGKKTLEPMLVATGTAANVRVTDEPQSIISTARTYTAVDHRFRSRKKLVDSIVYPITNGVISATSDSHLKGIFKRTEMRAEIDPITKTRYGIYVLILAFLAGPAIMIIGKTKKQKKGQYYAK